MSEIQRKRGRQTKAEWILTRRELEPYFEKNVPAYQAAKLTKHAVSTVSNHYDQLYEELRGYDKKNFVERYRKARTRYARTLDTLIQKSYEKLEHVDADMQKSIDDGEKIPSDLFKNHSNIMRDIEYFAEKEAAAMMNPDPSDVIYEEIKKHGDRNV